MLWQEEDILAQKYKVIRVLDSTNTPHKTYKIYDINWDKPFRLKRFCPSFYKSNSDKKLLYFYLKKWISLSGSYEIANAYYIREIQGSVCLITEYVEGCNLHEYSKYLNTKKSIEIAIRVASALQHAAQLKIVHGNLKFENVLITKGQEEHVKITDFLSFKSSEEEKNFTDYQQFLLQLFDKIDTSLEKELLEQGIFSQLNSIIKNPENSILNVVEQLKNLYEQITEEAYLASVKSSRFEIEQSNKQALSYLESNEKNQAAQLWMANMIKTPPSISATWNWHLLNFRNGLQTLDQLLNETDHLTEQDFERIACVKAQLALETGVLVDESLEEILLLHANMTKTLPSQRLEGELLFYLGEYEQAIKSFQELLRQEECEGDDWYRLGAAFFATEKYEDAFSVWEKGNQRHPNHLLLLLGKATRLFKSGKTEETQKLLESLADKYPDIFWANLHVAEFFSGQGIYERKVNKESLAQAAFYYKRIICKNPNMIRAIRGFHRSSDKEIPEVESPDTLEGWMQVAYFDHPENLITALDMSHDGKLIASGDCEGNIIIWDVIDESPLFIFSDHNKHISDVSFDKNCEKLISASWDNTLRIWDLSTGKSLHILSGHKERVSGIDVFDDKVLSGSWDGSVKIWRIDNGECVTTIESGSGWITDVSFCENDSILYCDENEKMHMWKTEPCEKIHEMQGSSAVVGSSIIVSTDSDAIYIWDRETGEAISQIDTYDRETGICLSEDGYFLLTRNEDEMLKIWYLPGKYCITILYNEEALCGAMTKDLKILVSANGTTISVWNNIFEQFFPLRRITTFLQPKSSFIPVPALIPKKISVAEKLHNANEYKESYDIYRFLQRIPGYEITSKILQGTHQNAMKANLSIIGVNNCILRRTIHFPYQIWNMDASNKNFAVFSCGSDPIRIWNLETDYSLDELHGHSRAISTIAISKNGNYAVSGSWDKTVRIWNINNICEKSVIDLHSCAITTVGISDCEKYTISGDRNGSVFVWDIEQEKTIANFSNEIGISKVLFLKNSLVLICDLAGYVYLWNFISQKIEEKLRPHNRHILDFCISADKNSFAITSRNKKISIYYLENLANPTSIEIDEIAKHVHLVANNSVAITTTYTGKVKIWKMLNGECIHEFQAHLGDISSCKVIDDRFLITINDNGEICLFEIDWKWE